MVQQPILQNNGEWRSVWVEEILKVSKLLARETGIFTSPASAEAFAGILAYQRSDKLQPNTVNVILLTGSE